MSSGEDDEFEVCLDCGEDMAWCRCDERVCCGCGEEVDNCACSLGSSDDEQDESIMVENSYYRAIDEEDDHQKRRTLLLSFIDLCEEREKDGVLDPHKDFDFLTRGLGHLIITILNFEDPDFEEAKKFQGVMFDKFTTFLPRLLQYASSVKKFQKQVLRVLDHGRFPNIDIKNEFISLIISKTESLIEHVKQQRLLEESEEEFLRFYVKMRIDLIMNHVFEKKDYKASKRLIDLFNQSEYNMLDEESEYLMLLLELITVFELHEVSMMKKLRNIRDRIINHGFILTHTNKNDTSLPSTLHYYLGRIAFYENRWISSCYHFQQSIEFSSSLERTEERRIRSRVIKFCVSYLLSCRDGYFKNNFVNILSEDVNLEHLRIAHQKFILKLRKIVYENIQPMKLFFDGYEKRDLGRCEVLVERIFNSENRLIDIIERNYVKNMVIVDPDLEERVEFLVRYVVLDGTRDKNNALLKMLPSDGCLRIPMIFLC